MNEPLRINVRVSGCSTVLKDEPINTNVPINLISNSGGFWLILGRIWAFFRADLITKVEPNTSPSFWYLTGVTQFKVEMKYRNFDVGSFVVFSMGKTHTRNLDLELKLYQFSII